MQRLLAAQAASVRVCAMHASVLARAHSWLLLLLFTCLLCAYLAPCPLSSLPPAPQIPEWAQGQLAVSVQSATGRVLDCTGLQTAGMLDDCFFTDEPLGDVFDEGSGTHRIAVWVRACGRALLAAPRRLAASRAA